MTFIYCLVAFGAGFFFGIFAIALIVFCRDKERRDERQEDGAHR